MLERKGERGWLHHTEYGVDVLKNRESFETPSRKLYAFGILGGGTLRFLFLIAPKLGNRKVVSSVYSTSTTLVLVITLALISSRSIGLCMTVDIYYCTIIDSDETLDPVTSEEEHNREVGREVRIQEIPGPSIKAKRYFGSCILIGTYLMRECAWRGDHHCGCKSHLRS